MPFWKMQIKHKLFGSRCESCKFGINDLTYVSMVHDNRGKLKADPLCNICYERLERGDLNVVRDMYPGTKVYEQDGRVIIEGII